jgi:succinylglutamate desuccinylase
MLPRRIGEVRGQGGPGPTVVVVGGMHGNEPAGVRAAERFLSELERARGVLRGTVLALTGNRRGLEHGVRFVRRDLNRDWNDATVAQLRDAPPGTLRDEDVEQRELLDELLPLCASHPEGLVFIDLHSTSSESPPFVCFGDTLRNRDLALSLGLPAIMGLEEVIRGAMLGYFADLRHVAIAIEAGQHEDPRTPELHLAALRVAAVTLGLLRPAEVTELVGTRRKLSEARQGVPRVLEIRHRHVVVEGDGFVMEPGFHSFQSVRRGRLLGRDRRGDIRAGEDALLLMPRYQQQGEDGFFLAGSVAPLWLGVSRVLRAARADRVVRYLPGLRVENGGVVVADDAPPRHVTQLMHLLGYRRRAGGGPKPTFSRRPD